MRERDGRPAGNRAVSVKSKLRIAFLGVAGFSLLSAIIGIASYESVDDAQREIIEEALPAARQLELLMEESNAIVAITPLLMAANDTETVSRLRDQIKSIERKMRIREAGILGVDSERFKSTVIEILAVLRQQSFLVDERNTVADLRYRLVTQISDASQQVVEGLRPAIIESTTRYLANRAAIRSSLLKGDGRSSSVIRQFNQLTITDMQAVERLTSMSNQAGKIGNAVDTVATRQRTETILSIRDQLNNSLRDLGRMTLETENKPLQQAIGKQLRSISLASHGPGNVFELQVHYLNIVDDLNGLTARNSQLRGRLDHYANLLKKNVDAAIGASVARAEDAILYGRNSLITIAIIALLTAAWIIWRYVLSDIMARLDRIAEITRRLAGGDLDVTVDVEGADELGKVADAMRLFKAKAKELIRSNAELEQFAYIASHDLKAPLRGIANLAGWIEEDIGDTMTRDTKKHLDLLRNRTERLEKMLHDLLQYSRAGRQKESIGRFDLGIEIPELFRLVVTKDSFILDMATPMPVLVTAPAPLEQIFRNMFSNALKHHDRAAGTITVACRKLADSYQFSVTDDGPGIPEAYQADIFNMFQTIHSRDRTEGSGMGLAIAKKVVESVGCKIWIEADPTEKRGTTFHFTWPVKWPEELIITADSLSDRPVTPVAYLPYEKAS